MNLYPTEGEDRGLPAFESNGCLPPGRHEASWSEVKARFGGTSWRVRLLYGLRQACRAFYRAGVRQVYLDGSFVSNKKKPNDYDVCWNPSQPGLNLDRLPRCLHPCHRDSSLQKRTYRGEFYPESTLVHEGLVCGIEGMTIVEFFQRGRDGKDKGIVLLNLEGVDDD